MFNEPFRRAGNRIHLARIISFIGSAFSEFAIPLFLFHHTSNPLHIGLQWSLIALTRLFAGQFATRLHFGNTDRRALVNLDLCLAVATLLPLMFLKWDVVVGAYLCTFFNAFLTTIQSGYIDSLVGHAAEAEKDRETARGWLLAKIENGRHVGMLVGYGLAYWVASSLGFNWAFVIDAASFVVSAALLSTVFIEGQARIAATSQASFPILFRPELRYLTIAQLLVGFGLFTYNATHIVFLKRDLGSSDGVVTLLFVLQYIGYVLGSFIPTWWVRTKRKAMPDAVVFWLRIFVIPIFILFGCALNGWMFIAVNAIFSVLIAAQLPGSVAFFQKSVKPEELRAAGAARIAVTSFSGAFGAAVASAVLAKYSGRIPFFYGSAVYAMAAVFLWIHLKRIKSI